MTRMRIVLLLSVVAMTTLFAMAAQPAPNSNNVGYWCSSQEAGVKYTPTEPFVVPAPPSGYYWSLLVIKAGSTGNSVDEENFVVTNPVVGNVYVWEGTWQGQPISKAISHVILCIEPFSQSSTTSSTTTSTTEPGQGTTTITDPTVTSSSVPSSTTTVTVLDSTTTTTTGEPTTSAPPITGIDAPPISYVETPIGAVPAGGGACAEGACEGSISRLDIGVAVVGFWLLAGLLVAVLKALGLWGFHPGITDE